MHRRRIAAEHRGLITFEAQTVAEIQQAFLGSVDDYLSFCSERGEEPQQPFSGKFVVQISPQLHRKAYIQA